MKVLSVVLVWFFLATAIDVGVGSVSNTDQQRVLVFTKTAGYRHGSISDGVALIKRLGRSDHFKVDRTENAGRFTESQLSEYDLVIFLSTTGDVLNEPQQKAFENYISHGGNFMGIHAAVDTEYDWPWYGALTGAYFLDHPKVQPAVLKVENTAHPATKPLPDHWERTDEWYDLKDLRGDIRVLVTIDEDSYKGGKMGAFHPVAWYREAGSSRIFYTAGGHTAASYREPLFEAHIRGGILWCLGRSQMQ